VHIFEPLALEYLGAAVRLDGHEVLVHDARLDPDYLEVFRSFCPDVIGLTGFTTHVNIIKNIAARLKEFDPGVFVIIGGHHATICPEDFNVRAIDLVVIGDGTFALREILEVMKGSGNMRGIRGLAIPSSDGMILTESRPHPALDDMPFPDRNLTSRYHKHYFSEWFSPLASVRTSLGCVGRCKFCSLWPLPNGKYLRRDPERVVSELSTISAPNVFFCDDESMCDVRRMESLAVLIRKAGIQKRYFLYARADTIVKHPALFATWASIGLAQVFVGMEDFSDARLTAFNKGINTEQQQEAAAILAKLGIAIYASFMIDPAYSKEDFLALHRYIRQLKLRHVSFTILTPLPGSEMYRKEAGTLLSRKPELYDLLHAVVPTRLPLSTFYAEVARLYSRAVPLHRYIPITLKLGIHGILLRMRILKKFLLYLRTAQSTH
jgi:radical SAM superfamily enzyme YgiQ (UPF0313 family)